MNRIDEIKDLASQTNSALYHSQRGGMYVSDVNYLLSIIEQAEKALERAKDYLESGLHYGPAEAIEEALQAIRGN